MLIFNFFLINIVSYYSIYVVVQVFYASETLTFLESFQQLYI
jgi:hypothetical protein